MLQDLCCELGLDLLGLCAHQEGKDELKRVREQVLRCKIGLHKRNESSILTRYILVESHHQHHYRLQQSLILTVQLHQSLIEPHLEQPRRDPIRNLADIGQRKQALMHQRNRPLIQDADELSQDGDFFRSLIEVANAGHIRQPFLSDIRIDCLELLKQRGWSRFRSLIGTLRPDVLLPNDFSLGQHIK